MLVVSHDWYIVYFDNIKSHCKKLFNPVYLVYKINNKVFFICYSSVDLYFSRECTNQPRLTATVGTSFPQTTPTWCSCTDSTRHQVPSTYSCNTPVAENSGTTLARTCARFRTRGGKLGPVAGLELQLRSSRMCIQGTRSIPPTTRESHLRRR